MLLESTRSAGSLFAGRAVAERVGLLGIVFKVVAAIVLIVVGIGAYLYFTDYEAKATITETGKDAGGPYAVVTPGLAPWIHHKASIPSEIAPFVCKGYHVRFHLQTRDLRVFDAAEKTLVYDSKTGEVNKVEALRCASGGGVLSF